MESMIYSSKYKAILKPGGVGEEETLYFGFFLFGADWPFGFLGGEGLKC